MTVIEDRPRVATGGHPSALDAPAPRPFRQRTADDIFTLIGAVVGSFGLVWLGYTKLLPFSGVLGFIFCWYVAFLAIYAGLTAVGHPRPVVVDRVMGAVVMLAALLVGFAVVTVVVYTFWSGRHALAHLNFFTHDENGVRPTDGLSQGGITHAIVGSIIQVVIAVGISLPLGIGTAVFMSEVKGWLARVVRTVVEAMTAIPDLLAGLFIYVTLIRGFGMERDGLAVGLALSVTMTPIIARSAEVSLKVVPGGLREAGLALGASQWLTVWRIVIPTARPGLATALILAIARGIGESAPLLIVSGASTFFNVDPLKNQMNSLPLYIYSNARNGLNLSWDRAFGAASVLLAIVLALFVLTRLAARQRVTRR